jgi:putative Ca2+/H+ antiporter (TMEM165/GDT1 family)
MWPLALSTFGIIFVAELGDKTLLTVLLLASRYRAWPVFLGGCLAFVVQGLVAVGLGQVFAFLPHAWIRIGSALLFLGFGLWLALGPEEDADLALETKSGRGPFGVAFGLVFLAEWGDMTQILTAALVADHSIELGRERAAVAVFGGATLGLWAGTGLAVLLGRLAGRRLPRRVIRRMAGLAFIAVAALTALGKYV